jgi:hypothetical protein
MVIAFGGAVTGAAGAGVGEEFSDKAAPAAGGDTGGA